MYHLILKLYVFQLILFMNLVSFYLNQVEFKNQNKLMVSNNLKHFKYHLQNVLLITILKYLQINFVHQLILLLNQIYLVIKTLKTHQILNPQVLMNLNNFQLKIAFLQISYMLNIFLYESFLSTFIQHIMLYKDLMFIKISIQ